MLHNQPNEGTTGVNKVIEKLAQTTRRAKAIGAGLAVFLKAIDRIQFAPEAIHKPDQKLIDEVVQLLLTGDKAKPND